MGEYLNNLRYTDNMVLFEKNIEELGDMLTELITERRKMGLNINYQEMKILGEARRTT